MKQACVFGASGGIGAALARQLVTSGTYDQIWAGSRSGNAPTGTKGFHFDLMDEASIADACGIMGALDLVIVATGLLQDEAAAIRPEKSFRALDAAAMAQVYAVNTIGPALIAKHSLPLLPKDRRGVFAAISARVGSIGDNRLGGWHAYRASKAALNMLIANFAIELARTKPQALAVGLHPGTVDTGLSAPFQKGVPEAKLFTPDYSASAMIAVLDALTPSDSGKLFAWDGAPIPF
jgi:NAD(P)-dependent dehydrogenase (short-subunit alcohol dehydrogenase family)